MLEHYKRLAPHLFMAVIFDNQRVGVGWHSCFANKAGASIVIIKREIQPGIQSNPRHMAQIGRTMVHLKKLNDKY